MDITIRSDDGGEFKVGDRAFNYYDMEVGTIGEIDSRDNWFDFHQDNGRVVSLNGERICTIEFATRKGWV